MTLLTKPDEKAHAYSLSVIVPTYNEESVLLAFHERLTAVLKTLHCRYEIIYVDDGSIDHTAELLDKLGEFDATIGIIKLTRNFGKEKAMTAGLQHVEGDAVVLIDADLQDPPELIPQMVSIWQQGYDVVNMRRNHRDGETLFKKITSSAFYRIINKLSDITMSEDVGDFRLLSKRAVDALKSLPESDRFMKGLFSWIGYRQITIDYNREARAAGITKWNYWRLWNFALDGITSFSTVPLRVATYIGLLSALGSFCYASYFLFKTLIFGDPVKGFPTIVVFVLLIGGLQLMAMGIIGEYLGRTYIESKRRPLYLIDKYKPATNINNTITNH